MHRLHNVYKATTAIVSFTTLTLVVLITLDVILRYLFHFTRTYILDLEWHVFSAIFLLGGGLCWLEDRHVRVDLFYVNFSPNKQKWVNVIGTIFLLIPWAIMMFYTSAGYAWNSTIIGEGSADPGGLPYRYIVKWLIPFGFLILILAAFIRLIQIFNETHKVKPF